MIKITKGLNLPIAGAPSQQISEATAVAHVAVLGEEFPGMRPAMMVSEGERVLKGQPLFEDKKIPGVLFYRARQRHRQRHSSRRTSGTAVGGHCR
ncbi:Na(+)-translocating NADH-quinone reductase subunit A [Pluralibacter gergoviae]|nr:Na(+)-translocating NADH-quinone reductase subunit A [Pluralibacter gergoviae]